MVLLMYLSAGIAELSFTHAKKKEKNLKRWATLQTVNNAGKSTTSFLLYTGTQRQNTVRFPVQRELHQESYHYRLSIPLPQNGRS